MLRDRAVRSMLRGVLSVTPMSSPAASSKTAAAVASTALRSLFSTLASSSSSPPSPSSSPLSSSLSWPRSPRTSLFSSPSQPSTAAVAATVASLSRMPAFQQQLRRSMATTSLPRRSSFYSSPFASSTSSSSSSSPQDIAPAPPLHDERPPPSAVFSSIARLLVNVRSAVAPLTVFSSDQKNDKKDEKDDDGDGKDVKNKKEGELEAELAREMEAFWNNLRDLGGKPSGGDDPDNVDGDKDVDTDEKKKKKKKKMKPLWGQQKNDDKDDKDDKDEDEDEDKSKIGLVLVSAMSAFLLISYLSTMRPEEISYQEFLNRFLSQGKVGYLKVVDKSWVAVYLRDDADSGKPSVADPASAPLAAAHYHFNIGSVEDFERKLENMQYALDIDPRDYVPVQYMSDNGLGKTLMSWVPTIAMIGVWLLIMRTMAKGLGGAMGKGGPGGMFNVGKSNAFEVKGGKDIKERFKDVAGLNEAKEEIMEFVKFLQHPEKFTKLGAKIPKGALLVGPPGTGKTLLAKATAGESSRPFYSISGSDFIEMYVGVGPSRVRDLFAKARKNAPCIIFIDEIDAVGRVRSKGGFSGGNDERENTLNQMLVEMDGFRSSTGVVVLAGTNRADVLDPALLRPGRFDRQIHIDLPDIAGRKEIFGIHLKPLTVAQNIDDLPHRLAALTPGFSGADISNLCNEAAIIAARNDKEEIDLVDFEAAADRVIGGLEKRSKVMTEEERELVAYHEAGHAVVGWYSEFADPVLKVTIVPRGNGALGYAQSMPGELNLYREAQLYDMMCMALGGRAAEQHFFGKVSSGASDDLKKVTRFATAMVMQFGMSPRMPNVSFDRDTGEQQFTKPYSEHSAELIDEEIARITAECYAKTQAMIADKADVLDTLAKRLLKDETINHDVLQEVLGVREFGSVSYREYVENTMKAKQAASSGDIVFELGNDEHGVPISASPALQLEL